MAKVNNFSQLESVLLQILTDCMNEVADRAIVKLREHIEIDVYKKGSDMGRNYYYDEKCEPTYDLHDSVVRNEAEVKGKEITSRVYHDKDKMGIDPDTFLHGSNYFSPNDVREMLPYIIDQGKSGSFFGDKWKNLTRPYMTNTRKELDEGLLVQWMTEALNKRGIKVGRVNIGASLE